MKGTGYLDIIPRVDISELEIETMKAMGYRVGGGKDFRCYLYDPNGKVLGWPGFDYMDVWEKNARQLSRDPEAIAVLTKRMQDTVRDASLVSSEEAEGVWRVRIDSETGEGETLGIALCRATINYYKSRIKPA